MESRGTADTADRAKDSSARSATPRVGELLRHHEKSDKPEKPKKPDKKGKSKDKAEKRSEKSGGKKSGPKGEKKSGKKPGKKGKQKAKRKGSEYTAETADKYELYQLSVQSPEADVEFLLETFRKERRRTPHVLREDFCGTGLLMCEWVSQGPKFRAEGFDLDPEPIAWGKEHNWPKYGDATARIRMHLEDARSRGEVKSDVTVAQNFSYSLFKDRASLLDYLRSAYENLTDDGMFVMDVYGGPESVEPMEEEREIEEGFVYVWDQIEYYPGTGEFRCAIHFNFEDGTQLRDAFEYDWRVWHMTELKDLLREAGFKSALSYFEGDDPETGEGDGNFTKDERGENCDAWIAYLVALK